MSHQSAHPPLPVDAAIARLQAQLGARVRAARRARGMSRRLLSEVSGVSPRYLAQIEAGEGNISVGLLLRVAVALDVALETLLATTDLPPEARRVAEAFAGADDATRARVRAALAGAGTKAGRICLIGLRGAGKSTLGAAAAAALDLPFVELNRAIEAQGGMPIAEIIGLYGPEGYRQLEARALDRIVEAHDRAIIAVAGGIVSETETFDRLLDRFHTIWLRAAPEDHMSRVRAQGDTRPMDGNPQAMAQLRLILTSREVDYARADARLDTSGVSVERSVADLLALIRAHRFVPQEMP